MRHSPKPRSKQFDELVIKSWWTILFILLILFTFDQAMRKRSSDEQYLQKKLSTLEHQRALALERQEDLKLQMASRDDEEWMELTLMRALGLVPEGYTKVYFSPTNE